MNDRAGVCALARNADQHGCFLLASPRQRARIYLSLGTTTPRELIVFVGAPVSARRNKKIARVLAPAQREDINMLDKAPNGKVSDLLNALDKALSAGDVEHAVDLFQRIATGATS
jgi:hypothetical protein